MKPCPDCHHAPSCRYDAGGQQCYCECHDLADDAPGLLAMLAKMTAEAMGGDVLDVTAREARSLMERHNSPVTDRLLMPFAKRRTPDNLTSTTTRGQIMKYKVNFGHDQKGRPKNRYFPSMDKANEVVEEHFRRTKVVLSIEAVSARKK